jgi:hypothetical protein
MSRPITISPLLTALLVLCLSSGTRASLFLDFENFNARNYGTADGLVAGLGELNDADIFPSSLAGLRGHFVSTGFLRWSDYVNFGKFTYGYGSPRGEAFSVSLLTAGTGRRPNYDEFGSAIDEIPDGEFMINGACAFALRNRVFIGFNAKLVSMNLYGSKGSWFGTGFSALLRVPARLPGGDSLLAGLGVQNIPIQSPRFGSEQSVYPSRIYSGGQYVLDRKGPLTVTSGLLFSVIPGLRKAYLSAGCELDYERFLLFRAGVYLLKRDQDVATIGFGARKEIRYLGSSKLEYSIAVLKNGVSHYFQLTCSPAIDLGRVFTRHQAARTQPQSSVKDPVLLPPENGTAGPGLMDSGGRSATNVQDGGVR